MDNNAIILDLSGDQDLFFALVALPNNVQDRVAKTAFKVPAERMAETAKQLAPEASGFLKKQIKVRSLRRNRFRVGVRVGTAETEFTGKAFYAYFQEYGWKQGKRPFRSRTRISERATRLDDLRKRFETLKNTDAGVLSNKARLRRLKAIGKTRSQIGDLLKAEKHDKRRQIPPKFYFRRAFDAHKNITAAEMKRNIIEAIKIEKDKLARAHTRKILNPVIPGAAQENRAFRLLSA